MWHRFEDKQPEINKPIAVLKKGGYSIEIATFDGEEIEGISHWFLSSAYRWLWCELPEDWEAK